MLQERRYWHTDDKKKIKVHEITYFSKDLNYKAVKMPALFNTKYTIYSYLKAFKNTLETKENKLLKYSNDVSDFCMLIINDCEEQFKDAAEDSIAKILFLMGLSDQIRKSKYYEIYLVTNINGKQCYIPLKGYLILSDCLVFFEFIDDNNLKKNYKIV